MCDSVVVVVPGQPVWLAKNSDRSPDEVQVLERHPAAEHPVGASLRATHLELPQARATLEIILSRPRWMWGCEMGVNARGLAVGCHDMTRTVFDSQYRVYACFRGLFNAERQAKRFTLLRS